MNEGEKTRQQMSEYSREIDAIKYKSIKAKVLKADAEMLAGRIGAKGYAVAVVTTVSGGRTIYRVRVGRFTRRDEADDVRARLANEEQMETWVVRTSTGSTPARR